MKKRNFAHFLARFWKTIILGFLRFIFNTHNVQNEDSVLRQFCNPVLDHDRIITSSAYKGEVNFAPFDSTKGSDNVFPNVKGKLLI